MSGYEGAYKGFKTSLDRGEEVESLSKSPASGILNDDYEHDNTSKLQTSFKTSKGTVKYNLAHSTSEKDGVVSSKLTDDGTVEGKSLGLDFKFNFKATSFVKHVDLGTQSYNGGSVLVTPYCKWTGNKDFSNFTHSFGVVKRVGNFKFNHMLKHMSMDKHDILANWQWKWNNWSMGAHAKAGVQSKTVSTVNTMSGYTDDKMSAFLETKGGDNGTDGFSVNSMNLHLSYKKDDKTDVGVIFNQDMKNMDSRNFTSGFRHKFDSNTTYKTKVDSNRNVSSFLTHKLPSGVTVAATFNTNLANVGSSTKCEGFKGWLNYPFNFGLRVKVDN